jgi:hypothetical protein
VVRSQLWHRHQAVRRRSKTEQLLEIFKTFPASTDIGQLRPFTTEHYGVSANIFYMLVAKHNALMSEPSFSHLVTTL